MRTVDALTAARDFFRYNPGAWTRAALARPKGDTTCFCALGGISLVTGCMTAGGYRQPKIAVSCVSGPWGANGKPLADLSHQVIQQLRENGIELAAAVGAVKYLTAACEKLFQNSIVEVNDSAYLGYDSIMRAFELAIKNAKRRHINGDRQKTSGQAVSL